jgi:hypothetical protein
VSGLFELVNEAAALARVSPREREESVSRQGGGNV